MKSTLKTWTTLGLASALMGAGLSGCAGEGGENGEAAQEGGAASGEMGAGEGGEGEGGEGEGGEGEGGEGEGGEGEGGEGEGGEGEGGVAISQATTDPVVYGTALAIVEAHAIAARDAYAAGKADAASEMFAHPVSEVLADMKPAFEELGVDDFTALMTDASEAAAETDNAAAVNERFAGIIAALRAASQKAPPSDASKGAVAAGIVSDQIDRAAAMYGQAAETEAYGPYLDGYGFYKAAAGEFERNGEAIKAADAGLYTTIEETLALMQAAYPGADLPAKLEGNEGALSGAASRIKLAL